MNYQIGRVCAVSDEVLISILDHQSNEAGENGVPESMTVHVVTETGPVPVVVGQPGTFVIVALPAASLLCMVTGVSMKEGRSPVKGREENLYAIDSSARVLVTVPVGTINSEGVFERGADVLPTVNAPVFVPNPTLLRSVFAGYAEGDFAIGRLSLLPDEQAFVNLDALLSRHAAILGQTGGGKSWTVASVIQKINELEQSTVVLFDLHGEYVEAFDSSSAEVISAADLELPYWLMNSEELLGLMVDRSESAAPNQIAKFKELLQLAKEEQVENQALGIKKITIDTPVFFDFKSILANSGRSTPRWSLARAARTSRGLCLDSSLGS